MSTQSLYCTGSVFQTVDGIPVCSGSWVMVDAPALFPPITPEQADSLFTAAVLLWVTAFVFAFLRRRLLG